MLARQLKAELKHWPKYVWVAYQLSRDLVKRKNRTRAKQKPSGKWCAVELDIPKTCRLYKCSKATLLKAIATLEEMRIAFPKEPPLTESLS